MVSKEWFLAPDKEEYTKEECRLAIERLHCDWQNYTQLDINLWIYEYVVNYGCRYSKLICLDLLEIPLQNEWTVEQKYRRINELFKQEARRMVRFK